MNKCNQCEDEYIPRQRNQRFCCTICANAWHAGERRRGVELLRSQTYHGRVIVEAAETPGRYAAVGAVTLSDTLPAPEWTRDPTGPEPPITGNALSMGIALGGEGRGR